MRLSHRMLIAFGFAVLLSVSALSAAATPLAVGDCSGSIAAGGTAQLLTQSNPLRRKIEMENVSTGDICYSWTSTTPVCGAAGSFTLKPAQFWSSDPDIIPTNAVYFIGAATGQVLSCFQG